MQYHAFWLAKGGNSVEEYEDAFAGDPARGRFALADGASESSFAGSWARLLVEDFATGPAYEPGNWLERVPNLQDQWRKQTQPGPLPWYAEAKFELGAFSTFLGLVLEKSLLGWRNRWQAVGVGDSCLFHIRADTLAHVFPLSSSKDFGGSPWLVGARNGSPDQLERKIAFAEGTWRKGDRMWLMTDSLAEWFLRRWEDGEPPWETLKTVAQGPDHSQGFQDWIQNLRKDRELRNDDVTWLAIHL
jgi:hypothetical protein